MTVFSKLLSRIVTICRGQRNSPRNRTPPTRRPPPMPSQFEPDMFEMEFEFGRRKPVPRLLHHVKASDMRNPLDRSRINNPDYNGVAFPDEYEVFTHQSRTPEILKATIGPKDDSKNYPTPANRWFHGKLNPEEVNMKLNGHNDGSFLVTEDGSKNLTLHVVIQNEIMMFPILKPRGLFNKVDYALGSAKQFDTIHNLLSYFKQNELPKTNMKLGKPVLNSFS